MKIRFLQVLACIAFGTLGAMAQSAPKPVEGLMTRRIYPPYPAKETYITSAILSLDWSALEPKPGAYDWTTLDSGVQAMKAAHVNAVKIRMRSGPQAPAWVKRLGSDKGFFNSAYGIQRDCSSTSGDEWGGVAVQNTQGPTACIPFFWKPEYQAAYDQIMKALEKRLESDPKYDSLTSVVDASCMAVYDEPFYRGQAFGATNHTLWDAGLTPKNDWDCQVAALRTHHEAFGKKRRTSLSVNGWDLVQATPGKKNAYAEHVWSGTAAQPSTYELVEQVAIPVIGIDMLDLMNNGLYRTSQCAAGETAKDSYFCYIAQYKGRRGFQTQTYKDRHHPENDPSEGLVLEARNALAMHANFMELPQGMSDNDWKRMACFDTAMRAGGDGASCK